MKYQQTSLYKASSLLAALMLAALAVPAAAEHDQDGVTLFQDVHFRGHGRYESFDYDDADLRDNAIRQDTISSIEVGPGCRAVLYSDAGFRGAATVLTDSYNDLRYSAVGNDRVSSIRVECRGR